MKKFFRMYKLASFIIIAFHCCISIMALGVPSLVLTGICLGYFWVLPENLWIKNQIPPEWWPNHIPYEPPPKNEYDLNF